jgi:hypothetical protein
VSKILAHPLLNQIPGAVLNGEQMLQKVLLAIYIMAVLVMSATADANHEETLPSTAVLNKN